MIGGVLQIGCRLYIKNHPELFIEDEQIEDENPRLIEGEKPLSPELAPRGGAFIEGVLANLGRRVIAKVIIKLLATYGMTIGLTIGSGIIISQIPADAISNYLRDAFPQNLPELKKTKFIIMNGKKVYLDNLENCESGLDYLIKIIKNNDIPFEEKEKLAASIFKKYLNLNTREGSINFVLCLTLILYVFSTQNHSGYYILLKNIIQAIKEGRISKALGRLLLRRLRRQGLPVDSELIEVIS